MDDFRLKKTDMESIFDHAVREHPFECCGIITGPENGEGENIVYPCVNIQNRLHAEDPEEHPRDARTGYYINPGELLKILKTTREKSYSIKAFYHSHIEHKSYFSEEDKRHALFLGEPAYPDAKHIVLSVMGGKVEEVKIFFWNEDSKEFTEEPLKVD